MLNPESDVQQPHMSVMLQCLQSFIHVVYGQNVSPNIQVERFHAKVSA